MKVVFATPHWPRPHPEYVKSLEASIPLIVAAGYEEGYTQQVKNAYISGARANMTRKALDARADIIVYLDHDLSWEPEGLLRLIQTHGDVVAGTYRMKYDFEDYMGTICVCPDGKPFVREDGCIKAQTVPAGFLKVTKEAIDRFMGAYPELCYGPYYNQSVDLFNHGAHERVWWGEDYAFCRRYTKSCGDIALIPDLNITHWDGETAYPGNFHEFLLRQPGGSKWETTKPKLDLVAVS